MDDIHKGDPRPRGKVRDVIPRQGGRHWRKGLHWEIKLTDGHTYIARDPEAARPGLVGNEVWLTLDSQGYVRRTEVILNGE